MDRSDTKFTVTVGAVGCPVCGQERRFWQRGGHNPAWHYFCEPCGVRFYGDQPRDLYRYFCITRRALARRGTGPQAT